MVEAPHGIDVEPVEGLDEARLIEDSGASQRVARIAAQVARDLGYRLVRVKISAAAGATVQIMAERPDGTMSIEDCERLSQALSPAFDVEEPMTQAYRLEISSPGIDRPLTRESDFARAIGHEVRIEMAAAFNGRKRFRGRLTAVAPGAEGPAARMRLVGDDMSETEVELPIRAMAEARLVLTDDLIRAALTREKAALKDAKRLKGRATDAGRNDNPGVATGMKSNRRKAVARGAASKPFGPDEGETHGR
ncbi:MAG TPA: ribosome maturation factor RimP [Roseiarcus sp.]|jgi:ribosome maturation factor RimP